MQESEAGCGPATIEAAEDALREFEREARVRDLAYMDEYLHSSETELWTALFSEIVLLTVLIAAAAWLAMDIIANLPHPH